MDPVATTLKALERQAEVIGQVVSTVSAALRLLGGTDGIAAAQLSTSLAPLINRFTRSASAVMIKRGRRRRRT